MLSFRSFLTNNQIFKYRNIKLLPCFVGSFKRSPLIGTNNDVANTIKEILHKSNNISNSEWEAIRNDVLSSNRNITSVNIDATILGFCISVQKLSCGQSYMRYLAHEKIVPNFGAVGKLLRLYFTESKLKPLSDKNKQEVVNLCTELTNKYKILDSNTLENVIFGLVVTDEWERCQKLLEDIKLTNIPSSNVYSCVISRAFDEGKLEIGWKLLNEMIENGQSPGSGIFESWITYCRTLNPNIGMEHIEIMLNFIGDNNLTIRTNAIDAFKLYLESNGAICEYSQINPKGACSACKSYIKSINITDEEFTTLKNEFLDKVLIRKNAFLKSTPHEIETFEKFLNHSPPFDIVIDGLNVAFSTGANKSPKTYAKILASIVEHFVLKDRHILVLGRFHMNSWPKKEMNFIRLNSKLFLTENLSQDDPFLLYAAIRSGPKTDIVSRDLMRGHSFLLGKPLQKIFWKWQQGHQYILIGITDAGKPLIRGPKKYCTYAHKINKTWHIPFCEETSTGKSIPLETPNSWMCVKLK